MESHVGLSDLVVISSRSQQKQAPMMAVTWLALPRKQQLAIITLCRAADFFQIAGIQAYTFQQLQSFDRSLPEAQISRQTGYFLASFTASQAVTAILWGYASDASWGGRKNVLLIGLLGTAGSCIGVGFSRSFLTAIIWRSLGGAINGTVGACRVALAETVPDKRFQSRAFLLLPIAFSIGTMLGPAICGALVNIERQQQLFVSPGVPLSGSVRIAWTTKYPFALPSIVCAVVLGLAATCTFFVFQETLPNLEHKDDLGLYLKSWLLNQLWRPKVATKYHSLPGQESPPIENMDLEMDLESSSKEVQVKNDSTLLEYSAWLKKFILTLVFVAVFDLHIGAFSGTWILLLSSSRYDLTNTPYPTKLPFKFAGGLALTPSLVGIGMSSLGFFGLVTQLLLYPRVHQSLGIYRIIRLFSILFPIAYFLAPYLSVLPSDASPPQSASGVLLWLGIVLIAVTHTLGRTFVLPTTILLLNASASEYSSLSFVHGVGQSVSALSRTIGPLLGGHLFSIGIDKGFIILAWWSISCLSALGWLAAFWI